MTQRHTWAFGRLKPAEIGSVFNRHRLMHLNLDLQECLSTSMKSANDTIGRSFRSTLAGGVGPPTKRQSRNPSAEGRREVFFAKRMKTGSRSRLLRRLQIGNGRFFRVWGWRRARKQFARPYYALWLARRMVWAEKIFAINAAGPIAAFRAVESDGSTVGAMSMIYCHEGMATVSDGACRM